MATSTFPPMSPKDRGTIELFQRLAVTNQQALPLASWPQYSY